MQSKAQGPTGRRPRARPHTPPVEDVIEMRPENYLDVNPGLERAVSQQLESLVARVQRSAPLTPRARKELARKTARLVLTTQSVSLTSSLEAQNAVRAQVQRLVKETVLHAAVRKRATPVALYESPDALEKALDEFKKSKGRGVDLATRLSKFFREMPQGRREALVYSRGRVSAKSSPKTGYAADEDVVLVMGLGSKGNEQRAIGVADLARFYEFEDADDDAGDDKAGDKKAAEPSRERAVRAVPKEPAKESSRDASAQASETPLIKVHDFVPPATEEEAAAEWDRMVAQGEARRVAWVRDGLVIPSSTLAEAWGRTRQALDQACARGELFAVKVGKNKYYPADFVELNADAIKWVSQALRGDDSVAKFIFWTRKHGGLGGRTIAQALKAGEVARATELALGWSDERGLFDDASA